MNLSVQSSVLPSLRALLAGTVDYAGLFPPAGLALEPALENQAAYVRGDDAWMLGRFVLPTAKLLEAGPLLLGRFDFAHPLRISALGMKASTTGEFLENLRMSLVEMTRFGQTYGKHVTMDQFEASLPPETILATTLRPLLQQAAESIKTLLPWALRASWEVPFSEELSTTLRVFSEYNAGVLRTGRCRPFGVKLRTGGTEAAAFPTPAVLAAALVAARDAGIAVKFTAGLHHPLRHFDDVLGTRMHGFLNVFAAGVLSCEHQLDVAETQAILEDECPESFQFDANGFAWLDRRVSTAALTAHRKFVTSFGSCSFDEPCDDLRRLGLLL